MLNEVNLDTSHGRSVKELVAIGRQDPVISV